MSKLYCKSCGNFVDPIINKDEFSPTGKDLTCPVCGFDTLEEAGVCSWCGEQVKPNEVLCADCLSDFNSEIREIWAKYKLTAEELAELLTNFIDYEM